MSKYDPYDFITQIRSNFYRDFLSLVLKLIIFAVFAYNFDPISTLLFQIIEGINSFQRLFHSPNLINPEYFNLAINLFFWSFLLWICVEFILIVKRYKDYSDIL
jgi:hypothetical protein